jgi:hypothetical protein
MASALETPQFHLPPERLKYYESFPSSTEGHTDVSQRTFNMLACYAVNVVEDMADHRPEVAIACDRGGRLFGLAVRRMWLELMDEPFPTLDEKLHFAKISAKSIGYQDRREMTEHRIQQRIDSALREGTRKGRVQSGDRPSVLVIDDWIASGATYGLVSSLSKKLEFDLRYAVMDSDGYKGIVEGHRDGMGQMQDRMVLSLPANVGVNYDSGYRVKVAPSEQVQRTRKGLYAAVSRVAKFVEARQ